MKIVVKKNVLQQALKPINRGISKIDGIIVSDYLHIQCRSNEIVFTITDLDNFIKTKCEVVNEKELNIIVNANTFLSYINKLNGEDFDITLQAEGNALNLSYNKNEVTFDLIEITEDLADIYKKDDTFLFTEKAVIDKSNNLLNKLKILKGGLDETYSQIHYRKVYVYDKIFSTNTFIGCGTNNDILPNETPFLIPPRLLIYINAINDNIIYKAELKDNRLYIEAPNILIYGTIEKDVEYYPSEQLNNLLYTEIKDIYDIPKSFIKGAIDKINIFTAINNFYYVYISINNFFNIEYKKSKLIEKYQLNTESINDTKSAYIDTLYLGKIIDAIPGAILKLGFSDDSKVLNILIDDARIVISSANKDENE